MAGMGSVQPRLRWIEEYGRAVFSPFLFTLYINSLEDVLVEGGGDMAQVGTRPIQALLYADDAVILGRTPRALQRLIDNFLGLLAKLNLKDNVARSEERR